MKKSLILSVAAAAVLSIGLHADENTDRMEAMEAQIKALQSQLEALKGAQASEKAAADEESDEGGDEAAADDEEDAGDEVDERLTDLEEQVSEINKHTAGSHLKFGVDFRTSVDNLQYKMAAKNAEGDDTQSNDAVLANRLWINMDWLATENMSFTGQLAYNKFYGYRSGFGEGMYPVFDPD